MDVFRRSKKDNAPTLKPVYFLTHAHTDHLVGLKDGWNSGHIFCSAVTKRLVLQLFSIDEQRLIALPIGEPKIVAGREIVGAGHSFSVTLVDANHCAGAVMFLFQSPRFGNILHTGDFRASHAVLEDIRCLQQRVDVIYLDNTFCEPVFDFPPQQEAACAILKCISDLKNRAAAGATSSSSGDRSSSNVSSARSHSDEDDEEDELAGSTLRVVLSVPGVGKEELLVQIAKHFQTRVLVSKRRLKTIVAAGFDPQYFTCDRSASSGTASASPSSGTSSHSKPWISAIPLNRLTNRALEEWNSNDAKLRQASSPAGGDSSIDGLYAPSTAQSGLLRRIITVGIKPTGFACLQDAAARRPCKGKRLFLFPYSLHSSYRELRAFVSALRPGCVVAASMQSTADRMRLAAMVKPFLDLSKCPRGHRRVCRHHLVYGQWAQMLTFARIA